MEDKSLGNKIYSEITIISYNFLNKGNDERPFLERLMETEYERNRPQLPDFIEEQRDVSLKFRGSSNQRIIYLDK